MKSLETIKIDYLVIGSGVAGLRAALEFANSGNVIVVTKDVLTESSTEYAQGGVAVALSDEDEVGIHFEDTIKAGDGLCRKEAVKILVQEGPERIMELIKWGAEFDKKGSKLDFTLEAAHSRKRVLHAHGDSTGKEIERVLLRKVQQNNKIKRIPYCMSVDLIIDEGVCKGGIVLLEDKFIKILSKITLLATGGGGQIFSRTTNPTVLTSDGMAMALRAGAILEDMEFVQFHPTVLYLPHAPQFLLSEAIRGEGGILKNIYGEPFMDRYHPDGELAPRDVVSRAIISEMVRTKSSYVYLDLTHLDSNFIKKRFPRIYKTCLLYDIDITKQSIPVSPAAHYIMGGVKTDIQGRTSIEKLYAAGEVACTGVHGANRLASNSLLEGLVFGTRAAIFASLESNYSYKDYNIKIIYNNIIKKLKDIKTKLRKIMWERVGIIRCEKSLLVAKDFIDSYRWIINSQFCRKEEIELKNMLTTAMIITESAIRRKCSIGAHYRSDYPERKNCLYHQKYKMQENGDLHYEKEEVIS